MTELDIAVVIVTYRCAALTIESLRSVAAERSAAGLHIRAFVVDNASGDAPSIAEAIESNDWRSWVTLVTAEKNGGFAYGNNLGIARAYQDHVPRYIYLLNPDAQVRPGAIEALARFLEAHPEVGIAGSSFENLDGSDWPIAFHFPTLMSEIHRGMELRPLMRLFKRWVPCMFDMPSEARRARTHAHCHAPLHSGSYPAQRHLAAKPQISCRKMSIGLIAEAFPLDIYEATS